MALQDLRERIRLFAHERDWEQFHTPKNLSMALAAEAGELLEVFQWLSEAESRAVATDTARRAAAAAEIADVLIYAIRLADVLGIDLESALSNKIDENAQRYPIEKSRGRADKAG